ncbi:hypothetical protein [Myroides fluvii]|uniref:hypothetical protein n=1 Tax=Myroides fluvii TaxID=2572594 RepID=UPI00131B8E64|nr:hypothetical protein [Myroides fluvii]
MYTAITLNGDTDFYYQNQLLYTSRTQKKMFKDIFSIKDSSNVKLIEIEIKHLFGYNKRYFIKSQHFEKIVNLRFLRKRLCLEVDGSIIELKKKIRAWKFEGDFIVNNQKQGIFSNKLTLLKSSFTFEFNSEKEVNFYCIILFSILVIDEFNTQALP